MIFGIHTPIHWGMKYRMHAFAQERKRRIKREGKK